MSQVNDSLFEWLWAHGQDSRHANIVNCLYNDIQYNSKIRYNVNLVCSKISGSNRLTEAILTSTQNV